MNQNPETNNNSQANDTPQTNQVGTHLFADAPISEEMLRAVSDAGYVHMTDIQHKVLPLIKQGGDIIGQSSTGTGKTAAFGIPAIEMIEDLSASDPQVLVLCPTRELAMQVSDELRKFSKYRDGLRVVTVFGGQNIEVQIRALKRASIVVGTPGRVIDHLSRKTLRLKNLKMVVLDEADEMLDMGFLDDIKRILTSAPEERQTVLFSATMSQAILRITQRFQKNPTHVKGDSGNVAFDLISQYYVEVPKNKKARSVSLLFEQHGASRGLIFANTKRMVDLLVKELSEMGHAARGLHGDMRQGARTEVMTGFKNGTVNMLVATDVAARGIDASGVDIIVNYDIPQDIEYYVHRIGRTGRAGRQGAAFTLIAGNGELFGLADIEDATGISLKPYDLQGLEQAQPDRFHSRKGKDDNPIFRSQPIKRSEGRRGSDDRKGSLKNAVISVDVGSDHDVTETDIVTSISKQARIHKDEFGKIVIKAQESVLEFEPETARRVMSAMSEGTINDFVVVFRVVSGVPEKGARGASSGGQRRSGFRRGGRGGGKR